MIRPRIMPHPAIHLTIGIPRPLGPKLPDRPLVAVLVVEELHQLVQRVAVRALRVRAAGPRRRDDLVRHVAEVESGFWVARAWACDELAEERGHCYGCGCVGVGVGKRKVWEGWLRCEGEGGDGDGDGGNGKVGTEGKKRVVVVHCKAGKGRSGTMACSYLISECGWEASEALARFTERRMRPGFGQGVSIPSQLRWVSYVDRWTKTGKTYVERQIEVMEVHVWGLREGVKVQVEGYVDEGKTIKLFHVFTKKERVIVDGNAPGGGGFIDKASDMAGFQNEGRVPASKSADQLDGMTTKTPDKSSSAASTSTSIEATGAESGGGAVIFRPSTRVILSTSDINIDFERRNKASMGWTMVTAVAHVWFNAFFEGNGPEQNGVPDGNGVFEIEWDKMDGIKGSSRKGTRAFDRLSVVWQVYDPSPGSSKFENTIREPGIDSPVPQMQPANWKGGNETQPEPGKDLGLRTESPASVDVSKASSINSATAEDDSEEGVKPSGPKGEEDLDVDMDSLPQPHGNASEPTLVDVNAGLDTASGTTVGRGVDVLVLFILSPFSFNLDSTTFK